MPTDIEQQVLGFARSIDRDAPTITVDEIFGRGDVSVDVDPPGRRSGRGWPSSRITMVAAATLVAVLVAGLVGLASLRDESPSPVVSVPPDPTPAPSAPTNSTEPGTTTPPAPVEPADVSSLVGRTWIRMANDQQTNFPYELELEFPDRTSAAGYDGCNRWTAGVTIGATTAEQSTASEQTFTVEFDPAAFDVPCSSIQRWLTSGQVTVSDGGILRLLDEQGVVEAEYIATDVLTTPTGDDLLGNRNVPFGPHLELLSDGTARLGICAPAGTWRYEDGSIELEGFDDAPSETKACAGGEVPGLTSTLALALSEGPVVGEVAMTGADILLRVDDGAFWLRAAEPVAALDLESSTVYGFGPPSTISADFVIDTVSATAGDPTFDTGWNIIPPIGTGEPDCLGGLATRRVFWGDLRIGFLRGSRPEDPENLEMVELVGAGRPSAGPVPPALPAEPTEAAQGVGLGSTIEELTAAGYQINSFAPDTHYLGGGVRSATLEINDGEVTDILYYLRNFC